MAKITQGRRLTDEQRAKIRSLIAAGMENKHIADRCGCSLSTVYAVIHGDKRPTLSDAKRTQALAILQNSNGHGAEAEPEPSPETIARTLAILTKISQRHPKVFARLGILDRLVEFPEVLLDLAGAP